MATLKRDKSQGGLRLCDIDKRRKIIKIGWIFRAEQDDLLRECMYHVLAPNLRQLIWKCNLSTIDVKTMYQESF